MTNFFYCLHFRCSMPVSDCQARQAKYDPSPGRQRRAIITGHTFLTYEYCGRRCEQKHGLSDQLVTLGAA